MLNYDSPLAYHVSIADSCTGVKSEKALREWRILPSRQEVHEERIRSIGITALALRSVL